MGLDQDHEPENEGIALVVAWHKGKGYEFGRALVQQDFAESLRSIVNGAEAAIQADTQKDYAIGDDIEDGEFMTAKVEELQRVATLNAAPPDGVPQHTLHRHRAAAITPSDPTAFRNAMIATGGMPEVNAAFLRQKNTAFYALIRGTDATDKVVYIRRIDPMKLAKPGHLIAKFEQRISKLDGNIFLMDDYIDIVIRPNQIDIFNKNVFDSMFFDLSADATSIDTMVRNALAALPILDGTLSELITRSRGKRRQRKKILEIQHSGHLATVTIQNFKDAVTGKYDLARFVRTENGQEIIFASEDDTDLLLEILNEDVYDGGLTGRPLVAGKKGVRKA
jgi:hypothetical protein